MQAFFDREIGENCIAAAFQNYGISGFKAQTERICRHVGTGFVDDSDDAEGNTAFADDKTVWTGEGIQNLSDRIGKRSDLAKPFCHVRNPFLRQGEPVKQPFRHAAAASGFQILCIFCKNVCCVRFQTFCRCKQRLILGIRIKPGKDVAGCFCLFSDFFQISHL